jgi:hypothetical protein
MTTPLPEVLDGAHYVETEGPSSHPVIWVWHGGHTVNAYSVKSGTSGPTEVIATRSISVGDFRTGEVDRDDVREGVEAADAYR